MKDMKGVRPGKHMIISLDEYGEPPRLSVEAWQLIGHNAETIRRLEQHLGSTRGIRFRLNSDFTVQAHTKGHIAVSPVAPDGYFSFEDFLDWAFAQPVLEESERIW